MKVFKLLSSVRTGLWFVPVICVLGGVLLSFGTVAIDRHYDFKIIPAALTGGPDAALSILSTVAASMVSLAALVLTITMVVVQLAMGQFSPRIVQPILRDKPSQMAIGIFVGTFAHAMLAMREVDFDGPRPGRVRARGCTSLHGGRRCDRPAPQGRHRCGGAHPGADPRPGRGLRAPPARRHRREVPGRFALPGSHHCGPGPRSLHDCLRQLAPRPFPIGEHRDSNGEIRLVVPSMDWDAYVHLAFDEIRIAGAASPQVSRRLHAALQDLKTIAPPDRIGVLDEQIDLLEGLTRNCMTDPRDAEMASRPDPQGIGVQIANGRT